MTLLTSEPAIVMKKNLLSKLSCNKLPDIKTFLFSFLFFLFEKDVRTSIRLKVMNNVDKVPK